MQGAHVERNGQPRPARTPPTTEIQQAARTGRRVDAITAEITRLWQAADSGKAFVAALHEAGYVLAQGHGRVLTVLTTDFLADDEDEEGSLEESWTPRYRRVGAALRHQGVVVNNKRLRRLMREHALQPKRRRRYVVTTDSDHASPIFPDLAKDVAADRPNQLWVADLTYVAIPGGFVYLAAILDAWSRKVVG